MSRRRRDMQEKKTLLVVEPPAAACDRNATFTVKCSQSHSMNTICISVEQNVLFTARKEACRRNVEPKTEGCITGLSTDGSKANH